MNKLTEKQLKGKLLGCSQEELIDVIAHLYKIAPSAAEFVNIRFGESRYVDALLEEKKNAIDKLLFPGHVVFTLPLSKLKQVVSDFQKVCSDSKALVDFQLYYVECGAEFIETYGGGPETFYSHLVSTFKKAIKELIKTDSEEEYRTFEPCIKKIIKISARTDRDFGDELLDIMHPVKWFDHTI